MAKATKETVTKNDVAEMPKDLVTQGTQEMATYDYGDDAVSVGEVAKGFENQTNQDVSIPFLGILQPISPEVAEQKIPGALAGQWFNKASGQLFGNPQGILFVPSTTRHEFTEFVPRTLGGGYVGRHAIDSEIVAKAKAENAAAKRSFGEYYVNAEGREGDKGNELTETFYVFGVLCDESGPLTMAMIPFKSTMIRCYKNWMSQIRQHTVNTPQGKKTPPLFAHFSRFTTEGKKNADGFFYVPIYSPAVAGSVSRSCLAPDDIRFKMAKACKEMVDSGAAKVNYDQQKNTGGEAEPAPF